MLAWLIGLPILVAIAAGIGVQLRRRPRRTLMVVKVLNLMLLVGAGVLVRAGSVGQSECGRNSRHRGHQVLCGPGVHRGWNRGGGSIDRVRPRRGIYRLGRPGRHERAA